jgi:hypothetical protein
VVVSSAKSDKITTMRIATLIGILVLFQQASWGATRADDGKLSSRNNAVIEPFLGDFLGSLNTAETPSPYDDLNHNPCGGPDKPPCRDEYNNPTPHLNPLANVIFRVSRNSDGRIQASIFQTTEQYRNDTPIDLMGQYCDSSIGDLAEYDFTSQDGQVTVANLSFPIHPGKCSDRLGYSLGSNFELKITLRPGEEKASQLEVRLYRGTENQNRTFVKRDTGETYEVRMKFEPRKYDEFERDYFHRNVLLERPNGGGWLCQQQLVSRSLCGTQFKTPKSASKNNRAKRPITKVRSTVINPAIDTGEDRRT